MTIAQTIDHTLLRPDATRAQILNLCAEAREFGFYSVCVNSSWVEVAADALRGSGVRVAAVTGFPLGAMDSRAKAFETRWAVECGADEIDTVLAVGRLKSGETDVVLSDLRGVVEAAGKAKVKVIFETCLLTDEEKRLACRIACEAGAAFVKTSTGFSTGGATISDVKLLAAEVLGKCLVKASGGIRSVETALAMLEAGASRLGTSNGIAIVQGTSSGQGY
ncbi:MAG: deoxyribose-phosphate aldolase [Chthoniobacterales bacterium]|nr:deoxyribose-phosphate aldolase [Chthoniobacterales bacterium]